jgi:hypothetical protein
VEKVAAGPVEKVAAGACAWEAHGGWEARWRERKTGCRALARRRCRLAKQKRDGEGGMVERDAQWRAPALRWRGGARSWRAIAALR